MHSPRKELGLIAYAPCSVCQFLGYRLTFVAFRRNGIICSEHPDPTANHSQADAREWYALDFCPLVRASVQQRILFVFLMGIVGILIPGCRGKVRTAAMDRRGTTEDRR